MRGARGEPTPTECWAIDLGTTNTVVARWHGGVARPVRLEGVAIEDPIEQTPMVPSQLYLHGHDRVSIGSQAPVADELLREVYLGRLAPLARAFKTALAREALRPVAQTGGRQISARECAGLFLREIVRLAAEESERERASATGRGALARVGRILRRLLGPAPLCDLVVTVPADSFERYRAELHAIAGRLRVRRFRTLDEPVAAALGYGVDLGIARTLMVVDVGGGTLDVAVVQTHSARAGSAPLPARVFASGGLELGGETVDGWLAEHAAAAIGAVADPVKAALRGKAESVKIALSARALSTDFEELRVAGSHPARITRGDLEALLAQRGLYAEAGALVDRVWGDARERGAQEIDDVLLVGGSTQLPGFAGVLEARFGRARVRSWSPFRAVAVGAALFGAGFDVDQIVHHDYAVRLFSHEAGRPEYEMIVPRGAGYSVTAGAERYYKLAAGQSEFELTICEVGLAGRRRIDWAELPNGHRYWTPTAVEEKECVFALNEGDSWPISPPGEAGQTRLRVEFHVDAEGYLTATVHDLKLKRDLRSAARIVKLR